jgi:hypothetical protein
MTDKGRVFFHQIALLVTAEKILLKCATPMVMDSYLRANPKFVDLL